MGNTFSSTTLTSAFVDYLGSDFTISFWISLSPLALYDSMFQILSITNSDEHDGLQLTFGLININNTNLEFTPFVKISNQTFSFNSSDDSKSFTFASSSDPAYTNYYLIIFKFTQVFDIMPNIIDWEVLDNQGNSLLQSSFQLDIYFSIKNPYFIFGLFNGFLSDVRIFQGSLTESNSETISSCSQQLGSQYVNLTINIDNSLITYDLTCPLCQSNTFSWLEVPQCQSSCKTNFQPDQNTNLCRCTRSDCLNVVDFTCDKSCGRCNAFSNENCNSCPNTTLSLIPSPNSCYQSCPENYCSIFISSYQGNKCFLCENYYFSATLSKGSTESILILSFSSDLDKSVNLSSHIQITVIGYSKGIDYTYQLLNQSQKIYTIQFTYLKSLNDRAVSLKFINTENIVDVNFFGLDSKYENLFVEMPEVYVITQEDIDLANTCKKVAMWTMISILIASPVLIWTRNLSILWGVIDSAQLMYFVLFIGFDLPENLEIFLKAFNVANLDFFPNLFMEIFEFIGIDINIQDQTTDQGGRLYLNGVIYTNFFWNSGRVLSVLSIFLAFHILSFVFVKTKSSESMTLDTIHSITGRMLIRVFMISYLQLVFSVTLEFTNVFTDSLFDIMSVIFSIIFAFIVIFLPMRLIGMLKNIVWKKSNFKELQNSALYEIVQDYIVESNSAKNFLIFLLTRKLVMIMFLLFLQDYTLYQSGLIINLTLVIFLSILVLPIYKSLFYTIVNLTAETSQGTLSIMVFIMICLSTFKSTESNQSDNIYFGSLTVITGTVSILLYAFYTSLVILDLFKKYYVKFSNALKNKGDQKETITTEATRDSPKRIRKDIELKKIEIVKEIQNQVLEKNNFFDEDL